MGRHTLHLTALATAAGLLVGLAAGLGLAQAGLETEALVCCGVLLAVAAGRYLWLGVALRDPIRRMADAADRIAGGDLRVWLPATGPTELRDLNRAFQRMVRRLRKTTVSRDDLNRVLGSMHGALFVLGRECRVQTVNATAAELLGVPGGDLVGCSLLDYAAGSAEPLRRALDAPNGRQVELELRNASGGHVPVLLSASRIAGRDDIVCVAQPIREQRDVEEELQRINVQLWLLNQVTTIALRTRELEPALRQIGEALQSSGGYSVVGFALRLGDAENLRLHVANGLAERFDADTEVGPDDGSILWQVVEQREPIILHMEGSSLELGDPLLGDVSAAILGMFPMRVAGRVVGVAILGEERLTRSPEDFGRTGMDLAQHVAALIDQKLASEALRLSNHELHLARLAAEDASRAKSEFLANMSHEIRTPMTAILGYADLVTEDATDIAETTEFVETIRRNGEHLMSIVNDILDLSKIEAGRVELELVSCSPVEIAREVMAMLRRRAFDRGLDLQLDLHWPLPRRIDSDPTRLRQILVNLVGNALKFTESGSVRLAVRRHPRRESVLIFEVVDTGIGMAAAELARLFKPFSQGESGHSRRFGGTGLGLAISQRLAAMLGGAISVQSRKGEGSTFSLEIGGAPPRDAGDWTSFEEADAAVRAIQHAEARAEVSTVEGRVLLAEDGPDNQRLISFLLRKAGVHVDVVGDGEAAVREARAAHAAGSPYDVLLMDMQMPVLDGYGAVRQLRRNGYAGAIVALTANAMRGDEDRCRAAGCDAFLSKPIDRRALCETVASCVERARQTPAAGA
jgi:signal transduction histidine kinase/PAS domain-containing protein